MSHFTLIAKDLDPAPLLAELDRQPELWNERPERRFGGTSPHRETSDIWIRYASPEAMREPGFLHKPHESVWWPAYKALPAIADLGEKVIEALGPETLEPMGGILFTRIPPGKQVYTHHDKNTWHSEYYDCKVWLVLRGNDQCVNTVEDESMVWMPGEAWQHDNLRVHSVQNNGDTERIVLILCFRRVR